MDQAAEPARPCADPRSGRTFIVVGGAAVAWSWGRLLGAKQPGARAGVFVARAHVV